MQSVLTIAKPFGLPSRIEMPLGLSVAEICQRVWKTTSGIVAFIRCPEGSPQLWEVVPDDMWSRVKPKGDNCLKFEFYPSGGSGRNLFAVAAAVLVSIAAPYLAGALLPGLAATSLAVTATTAAIAVGGNLLVAKLFSPEAASQKAPAADQAESAFKDIESDSNVIAQGIAPPSVHGERVISLPDAMQPHKYLKDGKDVIERVLVATGYHSSSDIQIDGIDIATLEGVDYQIRDGREDQPQQTLVKRVTKSKDVGRELTGFTIEKDNERLADQLTPANSEPDELVVSPGYHDDIEQITVRCSYNPFFYQSDDRKDVRYPLRITLKDKAGVLSDINLPEIHIIGRDLNGRRPKEIRIRKDDNFDVSTPAADFDYVFYREVPATVRTLSDGSTGVQWTAHSGFSSGSGITDTKNITANLDGFHVKLPSDVPWADFEVIIKGGFPIRADQFSSSSYELDGNVESLFRAREKSGSWEVPDEVDGVSAGVTVNWVTRIVKRYPVEAPGYFQLAIKSRGVSPKNITMKMGLYVDDWGGTDWNNLIVTKNPAPHFRYVLRNGQSFSRVSHTLNRDDEFLDWRNECVAKGYEVNFIATGQAYNEVLGHIATAGFATKSFGTGYGIAFHKDRTAETPEMTFSHRDSKITYERVFSDSPKGYLVDFEDETKGFKNDGPITINNPYGSASLEANEQKSLPSITNPVLIERRTLFDALQEAYRPKIIKIETGPAGFHRKRGDMIGVVSDLDSDYAHGFFIRQVLDARTVAVDRSIPVEDGEYFTDYVDVTVEEDITAGGEVSTAHILTPAGLEAYTIENVTDNIIRFTSDIPESWTLNSVTHLRSSLQGTRMTVAANSNLFKRCFVLDVARQGEQRATIYAVEEKPEIEEELMRLYG